MFNTIEQRFKAKLLANSALVAVFLGGTLIATAAWADAAPDSNDVETVVVTARKTSEAIDKVPMTISAFTNKQIEDKQLNSISDLVERVPGMSTIDTGAGQNVLTLRGVSSGYGQFYSTVGVYIDDIPIGSSNAYNEGGRMTGDLATVDLARVEVLQGPQGTLYGADSLGGLIKYVTNQPDPSGYSGKISLGGINSASGASGYNVNGVANLPITDNFAVRIDGFDRVDPGYNTDILNGVTKKNFDRNEFSGGHVTALLQVTPDLQVTFSGFLQNIQSGGAPVTDLDGSTAKPLYGDYTQERMVAEPSSMSYRLGAMKVDWDLHWATLTSVTAYSVLKDHRTSDFTGYYGGPGGDGSLFGVPDADFAVPADIRSFTKKTNEEARLTSNPGGALDWQLGFYYDYEDGAFDYKSQGSDARTGGLVVAPAGAGYPTPYSSIISESLNPSTYRDLAGFGSATYHFTPAVSLTGGVRLSNNTQSFNGQSIHPLRDPATDVPDTGSSKETSFTWLASPQWQIDENNLLYATVATGFRPGGPNGLPENTSIIVPPTFKSSSTTSYEAGYKAHFWDDRVYLAASAFHVDWKDIQIYEVVDNIGVAYNGTGAAVDGFQLSGSAVLVPGLTLSGDYGYNDARLTADTSSYVGGLKGDPLPSVPKNSGSASLDYTTQLGSDTTGSAGVTYRFLSSRWSDYSQAGRVVIPGYGLTDINFSVDVDKTKFSLVVKNVFDTVAYTAMGYETVTLLGYTAPRRTIGFYVTKSF
jgi:outer membrane receptor protein involved in Fe transport